MRLKNKRTGEIKEVIVDGYPVSGKTEMWECSEMDLNEEIGYKFLGTYNSLAELNAEWEDVPEEPKEYWFMDYGGRIKAMNDANDEEDVARKEIGNYFETKEEAEKAVEKLRAWKRLKDKGFRFDHIRSIDGVSIKYKDLDQYTIIAYADEDGCDQECLDLLFGGEE